MTQPEDPSRAEPSRTGGLEPGGGVSPGDTPPAAGSMSGAAPDTHKVPNQGPVSGNRTPMLLALGTLLILVLMIAVLTGASFFAAD